MVAGLEKHGELQEYVEQIENGINNRSIVNIAIHIRLSVEYITDQYLQEYPLCIGEEKEVFSNIDNLLNNEIIDEEDASLFHAMRKYGNEYGAHRKKQGQVKVVVDKEAVLAELIELADRFFEYLPVFLRIFPTPSEKPMPKAGAAANLGFKIDFESIQPLELHPNWRECIGYQDMLKFREMPQFAEYVQNIYDNYNDSEIFYWFWCVMLTDRLHLIARNGGKEYLDIRKLVEYYYEALRDAQCDDWMQLPDGYEGTYYIPAIIREYFPNDLAHFCKGKGFEWVGYKTEWEESWENRRNKTIAALANGETAVVKQALIDEIFWYTVGKEQEEEKERQAAAYQKAQAKKREEAREAARIAQEKKEYEERKARREKEQEKERQQLINKIKKSFVLIFAVVFAMYLIIIVFNFIFGNGIIIQLLLIAAIVYFVMKRKNKKE